MLSERMSSTRGTVVLMFSIWVIIRFVMSFFTNDDRPGYVLSGGFCFFLTMVFFEAINVWNERRIRNRSDQFEQQIREDYNSTMPTPPPPNVLSNLSDYPVSGSANQGNYFIFPSRPLSNNPIVPAGSAISGAANVPPEQEGEGPSRLSRIE